METISTSMIDTAVQILQGAGRQTFKDLYDSVCSSLKLTGAKRAANAGKLYFQLCTDGRVCELEGNSFDIKQKHTLSETIKHVDEDDEEISEEALYVAPKKKLDENGEEQADELAGIDLDEFNDDDEDITFEELGED